MRAVVRPVESQRDDNTGFTQAIALAAGKNATSAPADVTITGNEISDLETGAEDDSAPATHLILSSVEDADTVEVENNDFSAVSTGENYILDNTEEFDMETLLGDNDFDPDGEIADGDDVLPVAGAVRCWQLSDPSGDTSDVSTTLRATPLHTPGRRWSGATARRFAPRRPARRHRRGRIRERYAVARPVRRVSRPPGRPTRGATRPA